MTHEVHHVSKKPNYWKIASLVLFVLLVISFLTGGIELGNNKQKTADTALAYVNENLLQPGTAATLKEVNEEAGLYKITLDIQGQEFDSYVSKDGKMLFPSAVDMTETIDRAEETQVEPADTGVEKNDKPEVELFVMSHCPFGTQAEKGILPVAEMFGDKIDFDIKFVNYAMHGEKEVVEQLKQYCISEEQNDKFLDYLTCFLTDGNTERCLTETNIDVAKLDACYKEKDSEFKVTELLEDRSSWASGRFPLFMTHDAENKEYEVRGSPTLVLNGQQVSSGRSPAAFLATICSAFNEPPEECQKAVSSANPSSGFGWTESDNAAAASCAT